MIESDRVLSVQRTAKSRRSSALVALAVLMLAAPLVAQERCPVDRPVSGHLGFKYLHCPNGGPCWDFDEKGQRRFDLTNVPRVRLVDEHGPAAGLLHDGDMIVTVDGLLTTSKAGGRRLANLVPGTPVTLRVQRGTRERDVTITPVAKCGMMLLSVNSVSDSAGFVNRLSPTTVGVVPGSKSSRPSGRFHDPVIRRSTPMFDLEFQGDEPLVVVDSVSGAVTLKFRGSEVRILPRAH